MMVVGLLILLILLIAGGFILIQQIYSNIQNSGFATEILISLLVSFVIAVVITQKNGSLLIGIASWIFVSALLFIVIYFAQSLHTYVTYTRPRNTTPDTILLAGKVVDPLTSTWSNNRLILVFEQGKEVGRTTSIRGEFPESKLGVIDGLFAVEIPNPYRFTLTDFEANHVPFHFQLTKRSNGVLQNYNAIYYWFPFFVEGESKSINLPSKNVEYVIKILEGDISQLPDEILANKTEFRNGLIIIAKEQSPPSDLGIDGEFAIQNIRSNLEIEKVEINKVTVPLDNCKSDQELKAPYVRSQTFVHKYYEEKILSGGVQVSIPVFTWLKIVSELQSKYGFEDNQVSETKFAYYLTAAPRTYQYYVITWTEIWEKGVAYVVKNNQSLDVPFRVKTNVIYQVESETRPCP